MRVLQLRHVAALTHHKPSTNLVSISIPRGGSGRARPGLGRESCWRWKCSICWWWKCNTCWRNAAPLGEREGLHDQLRPFVATMCSVCGSRWTAATARCPNLPDEDADQVLSNFTGHVRAAGHDQLARRYSSSAQVLHAHIVMAVSIIPTVLDPPLHRLRMASLTKIASGIENLLRYGSVYVESGDHHVRSWQDLALTPDLGEPAAEHGHAVTPEQPDDWYVLGGAEREDDRDPHPVHDHSRHRHADKILGPSPGPQQSTSSSRMRSPASWSCPEVVQQDRGPFHPPGQTRSRRPSSASTPGICPLPGSRSLRCAVVYTSPLIANDMDLVSSRMTFIVASWRSQTPSWPPIWSCASSWASASRAPWWSRCHPSWRPSRRRRSASSSDVHPRWRPRFHSNPPSIVPTVWLAAQHPTAR